MDLKHEISYGKTRTIRVQRALLSLAVVEFQFIVVFVINQIVFRILAFFIFDRLLIMFTGETAPFTVVGLQQSSIYELILLHWHKEVITLTKATSYIFSVFPYPIFLLSLPLKKFRHQTLHPMNQGLFSGQTAFSV
jgi:hypothetical protein